MPVSEATHEDPRSDFRHNSDILFLFSLKKNMQPESSFNEAIITKPTRKPRKERINKKKQVKDKQITVEDKENIDP
jgi:hypothetical protein